MAREWIAGGGRNGLRLDCRARSEPWVREVAATLMLTWVLTQIQRKYYRDVCYECFSDAATSCDWVKVQNGKSGPVTKTGGSYVYRTVTWPLTTGEILGVTGGCIVRASAFLLFHRLFTYIFAGVCACGAWVCVPVQKVEKEWYTRQTPFWLVTCCMLVFDLLTDPARRLKMRNRRPEPEVY